MSLRRTVVSEHTICRVRAIRIRPTLSTDIGVGLASELAVHATLATNAGIGPGADPGANARTTTAASLREDGSYR
jgi:hypothetical protein